MLENELNGGMFSKSTYVCQAADSTPDLGFTTTRGRGSLRSPRGAQWQTDVRKGAGVENRRAG